ncbi:hypothetical protein CDL12_26911 [Handroanthus impetiginosus]|uniref:Uncharacterized protein n=1 Tax=Handroanthus impetiginosus TaxID=429701 RepID=A0A2G9G619_9LAMI|nr:hypothetical protein CDL12_26911 [Handroanthus impetiginosus]
MGFAHAEPGLLNSAEQPSSSVAAKNSALQESSSVETGCAGEIVQIYGTKRPLSERLWSPVKSNFGVGHIVYVRRKPETELAKSHVCESEKMSEPVIGVSDVSPVEGMYSPSSLSTRGSVTLPLGIPERYLQLQRSLKMLDESNQDDYVQMLQSLSSVELSQHAVELEKWSITLQLEEGSKRVGLSDHLKNVGAAMTPSDAQVRFIQKLN